EHKSAFLLASCESLRIWDSAPRLCLDFYINITTGDSTGLEGSGGSSRGWTYVYIKKGGRSADEGSPPGTRGCGPARGGRPRRRSLRGPRSRRRWGPEYPHRPSGRRDGPARPRL